MSKPVMFAAAVILIFFGWVNFESTEQGDGPGSVIQTDEEVDGSNEQEGEEAEQNAESLENTNMDIREADKIKIREVALQIEIADNPLKQYQGLSGRESLCDDCGMLFVFGESRIQNFSMRGMRFGLDFLFISGNQVLEIRENIPAPKEGEPYLHIQSSVEADMVLEVNAGFVSRQGIKVGDRISIDE